MTCLAERKSLLMHLKLAIGSNRRKRADPETPSTMGVSKIGNEIKISRGCVSAALEDRKSVV